MEIVKRDVDELNELAKKMTGVNPKAKTTAQALNYIEQNYSGGGSSNIVVLEFVDEQGTTINLTPAEFDTSKLYFIKSVNESENEIRYMNYVVTSYMYMDGGYSITAYRGDYKLSLGASTPNERFQVLPG